MAPPPVRGFRWNPGAAQYIDPFGRFVPRSTIRGVVDSALDDATAELKATSQRLMSGQVSLNQWRDLMQQNIKNLHLWSAAAAKGGWAQFDQADFGRIGTIIRGEYGYLERFARQIASGAVDLDGRFLSRVELYQQAGRDTYHQIERQAMKASGKISEMRNVLNPAEHCTGPGSCVEQRALGWMKLADKRAIPIGRRVCGRRCRCEWEYR